MTKKKQNRNTFVKNILRRASFHWSERSEALRRAKVDRGIYLCARCQGKFPRGKVQLDHIEPVVDPVTGFTTYDSYIERLFCDAEGFQVICETCHEFKTLQEDMMREVYKTKKEDLPDLKKQKKLDKKTKE